MPESGVAKASARQAGVVAPVEQVRAKMAMAVTMTSWVGRPRLR